MQLDTDILFRSDRDEFLEAVIGLCAERGWQEVTVEALAERSGLSEERFAELFGESAGVEECMLAAETAFVGEVVATVSATHAAERYEWDSGIRRMLAVLELLAANPSKAHFGCITARCAGPRVREAAEGAAAVLGTLVDELRISAPDCRAPVRAGRGVVGGGEALIRAEIAAGRAEELPRLAPTLIYASSVPYLAQELALGMAARARALLRGTAWE
jgi:hypothetical protein